MYHGSIKVTRYQSVDINCASVMCSLNTCFFLATWSLNPMFYFNSNVVN